MIIRKFSLGQLQANCYFVIDHHDCLIIDPADDANFLLEEILRQKLSIKALLATHGHFDHLMAVGEIQASFKAPLYISDKDLFLVDRLDETAAYFLGCQTSIIKPSIIKKISQEKPDRTNLLPAFGLEIIPTPGHTPGSLSFYFPKVKTIFSGDTLFKQGIGRYDFSYARKKDLESSLKKILQLPEKTVVYPGHGDATTIKDEKSNLLHLFN